jgi:4-diphosphocytidyl-2-C-methyl-D-erythritol kinase
VGERVEPIGLPALAAVLCPCADGLSTRAVYAELDRRGEGRNDLDPEPLRHLAGHPGALVAGLENDLESATLALRPELAETLTALRDAGAVGAAVSGSGPTCFGLFETAAAAEAAAATLPNGLAVSLRHV